MIVFLLCRELSVVTTPFWRGRHERSLNMKTNVSPCVSVAFYFRTLKSVTFPSMVKHG